MNVARCRSCGVEFTDAEIAGATACPACGCTRAPIDPREDVTLTLNWFDLRCLANWAERWSEQKDFDVESRAYLSKILDRIRAVKPAGAAGLTLRDELSELHDHGLNAELRNGAGDVLMKPPTRH